MIVKGVSVHRDENDCNYDYNLQKNLDNQGMRFYMHKYFTGHMHYYLHLKYQQQLERLAELRETLKAAEKDTADLPKEDLASSLPQDEMFEKVELERETREITFKLRKQMNDLTMRMFLRTTVCFRHLGVFEGKDPLYSADYSGNHIAIFECELKAPPQLSLVDHTYN